MFKEENLFILTKTYPLPSKDYREHTCVAAITEEGQLRRIYPIPFRLLDSGKQFKRWQWISAEVERSSDKRPESHRINTDTIKILSNKPLGWPERMSIIEPQIFNSLGELDANRISSGQSLGIIHPTSYQLEIEEEKSREWTPKELVYLTQRK